MVILLGAIYTGVVTPTEAGAIAATWALIISIFFYRAFGPKDLLEVMKNTVKSIGILSFMVGAAYAFSYIVAIEKIPDAVANGLLSITDNKYVMLLVMNVVFLLLGCFMDTSTIQLVFIPIILPVINKMGIDLVHFGVVIVLNMMIGLSTPPFGMLLFVVTRPHGRQPQRGDPGDAALHRPLHRGALPHHLRARAGALDPEDHGVQAGDVVLPGGPPGL